MSKKSFQVRGWRPAGNFWLFQPSEYAYATDPMPQSLAADGKQVAARDDGEVGALEHVVGRQAQHHLALGVHEVPLDGPRLDHRADLGDVGNAHGPDPDAGFLLERVEEELPLRLGVGAAPGAHDHLATPLGPGRPRAQREAGSGRHRAGAQRPAEERPPPDTGPIAHVPLRHSVLRVVSRNRAMRIADQPSTACMARRARRRHWLTASDADWRRAEDDSAARHGSQTRPDDSAERVDLALRHVVTSGQRVRGEQEDVLDTGLLAGAKEAVGTVLGRPEEAERVRDARGEILRDVPGRQAVRNGKTGLAKPVEVRPARIGQPRVPRSEPFPGPAPRRRQALFQGEGHDEHGAEAVERAGRPAGAGLEMAAGRSHRVPVEAHHQERAVGHLAGQLHHARPRGQKVDRRRRRPEIPEAARRIAEGDGLAREQPAEGDDGRPHRVHGGPALPDAPRRQEARRDGEAHPPRRELVQAVRQGGQQDRMANDRARGRRVEPDPPRPLRSQREDQVRVPPAVGMVVDADSVEARVLAPRDDVRHLGDGPSDGNPDVYLHGPRPGVPPDPASVKRREPSPPTPGAPAPSSAGRQHRQDRQAQDASARRTTVRSRSPTRGTPVSASAWSTSFARISSARRTPADPPTASP